VSWSDDLSGPHLEIAKSESDRIGVLAGPGTGKTTYGLMRRVARLIEQGVDPKEILLISFTRTAAHDLREKIADLGIADAESVRATTLHSYCFSLLMRDAVLSITRRTPRPLLDHEVDLMLRDLDGDFGHIDERRDLLNAYEAGWARQTNEHPFEEPAQGDLDFQAQMLRWLRHHRAMLIGEVVPLAYTYLRDNPMADELGRYKHIVVDEYQDLNSLEQALLELLAGEGNLCIAGDDDQSIYGFRYANPEGILDFVGAEGVQDIAIDTCGRCPGTVLAMANELMSHAPGRSKGDLKALKEVDGEVSVVQWAELAEEIDGIAAAIAASVADGKREPGEILVLANRQKIGEMLRKRLAELEIPAHSFYSQESVSTDEAQYALALLRLAATDKADLVSLRVILGLEDGEGRAKAYARLEALCSAEGRSEWDVLEALREGENLDIRVPAFVKRFKAALAAIEAIDPDDLPAVVDQLFPADSEGVEALRAIALEVLPEADGLAGLCDLMVTRVSQQDVPENPDFVRIMSFHKSKGLTSPAVYLVGMVDGIIPTIKATADDQAAEEAVIEQRRLVYVALTRAAEELVISSSARAEVGDAYGMGMTVERNAIRRIGNRTMAPTVASPYLAEFSASAPRAVRGSAWLASRS
jgi:DNA helicase II / ATP-dependent DNA helicase PcrA